MFFKVDIDPVPKGRPRFSRGHAYTPKKTRDYESEIRKAFEQSVGDGFEPYPRGTPLLVSAVFAKAIPKSYTKKRRQACLDGTELPASGADLDNYLKAVTDALNGVAFEDDSQIVYAMAEKIYSAQQAYVVVTIKPYEVPRYEP